MSQRSYPSFVAGLPYRSGRRLRARYAAEHVLVGDELEAVPEPGNRYDPDAVALYHEGFLLGYVPQKHSWIARSIAEGDVLYIVVDSVTLSDEDPDKAARVGLMVSVLLDGDEAPPLVLRPPEPTASPTLPPRPAHQPISPARPAPGPATTWQARHVAAADAVAEVLDLVAVPRASDAPPNRKLRAAVVLVNVVGFALAGLFALVAAAILATWAGWLDAGPTPGQETPRAGGSAAALPEIALPPPLADTLDAVQIRPAPVDHPEPPRRPKDI